MNDDKQEMYLCQVSDTVSCGACCGLYNVPNLSRKKLEIVLTKRTEDFRSVPRVEDEIFAYKRRHSAPHRLSRPYPQFHLCAFLGFIDARKRCVGCLLHPESPGNKGTDFRSLSWYGEQACRTYFCPSSKKLSPVYVSILRQAFDDWFIFGLIVTEYVLVTAYFKEIESRIGREITKSDYLGNDQAKEAFREFAKLKTTWPYRRKNSPGPCNFFFENGLYPKADVYRATPDIRLSRYEKIFRELDSGFSSAQEIEAVEQILNNLFVKAAQSIKEFSF